MPLTRSQTMARVKGRDTRPELIVRQLLTQLGYRYRLHRDDLPGRPDIVFIGRRKAILVHGCFWHGHQCRRGARLPKTNADYWVKKIAGNRARDARAVHELDRLGWEALTLWECMLPDVDSLSGELQRFLGPTRRAPVQSSEQDSMPRSRL